LLAWFYPVRLIFGVKMNGMSESVNEKMMIFRSLWHFLQI